MLELFQLLNISLIKTILKLTSMKILTKENYGDLKSLKELGKTKQNSFTTEQLLDEQLKNIGGENRIEVTTRMEKAFERVINENIGNSSFSKASEYSS